MKKTLLLMIAACTFAACNKSNTGNTEAPKRLITKIVNKDASDKELGSFDLKYDNSGRMTGLNFVKSGTYSMTSTSTIEYSDTKVVINTNTESVYDGNTSKETTTVEATLNAQKYAETILHKNSPIKDGVAISSGETNWGITYAANGQVTGVVETYKTQIDRYRFDWTGGNLTGFEEQRDGDSHISETSTLKYNTELNNVANIDINWFLYSSEGMSFMFGSEGYAPTLAVIGCCGVRSTNYIVEQYVKQYSNKYVYEYTFDAEKYPTEVKLFEVSNADGKKSLNRTLKISYNN